MTIVSSLLNDATDANGRRIVHEKHINHLGDEFSFVYYPSGNVNAQTVMEERVSSGEVEQLALRCSCGRYL